MSELKTRYIDDTYVEYYNTGKHELAQVYLKSDADKVIAHQKYKRCLAMAQWCMDAECKTEKDADFLVRWEHRWLTLAEQYKEAK